MPTARELGMEELLNADAAGRSAKRANDFIVTNVIESLCFMIDVEVLLCAEQMKEG